MSKDKLKPGFDPIWQSDLIDLRSMSKTAYILRQIYRLYRNPETNLVNLSDYTVNAITGWHLRTIKKARLQLIALKEINPKGYHIYEVPPFHQFKSMAENAIPQKSNNGTKCHTSMAENAIQNNTKCHTGMAQKATPYNTDLQIQTLQTEKSDSLTVEKPVNKDRVCQECANFNPQYQTKRGPVNWCPKMGFSPLPNLNAADCQNFFVPVAEISQQKVEQCQTESEVI